MDFRGLPPLNQETIQGWGTRQSWRRFRQKSREAVPLGDPFAFNMGFKTWSTIAQLAELLRMCGTYWASEFQRELLHSNLMIQPAQTKMMVNSEHLATILLP
jgi:hypothetical protein